METKNRIVYDKSGKKYIAPLNKIEYKSNEKSFSINYHFYNEEKTEVGMIQVNANYFTQPALQPKGVVEIMYLVRERFKGIGIAPAMLKSIQEAIFEDRILNEEMQKICNSNINSIFLIISKDNIASQIVARKCGFNKYAGKDELIFYRTQNKYFKSKELTK